MFKNSNLEYGKNIIRIIFQNNKFSGIMQELLLQKLDLINETKDLVYVEIFLNIDKKQIKLSESIKTFRAWEAKSFLVYIRITIIKNEIEIYNDKINLFQLLKYYSKKLFPDKYEFMTKKFEFEQSILRKMGVFFWEELKSHIESEGFSFLKGKNFAKQIISHNDFKQYSPIQIYRSILSLKPQQIVTVLYDGSKEIFVFKIYNHQKSKMVECFITIKKAELFIPYIKAFLNLHLYEKLGFRLVKELNIKLLLDAYLKIK